MACIKRLRWVGPYSLFLWSIRSIVFLSGVFYLFSSQYTEKELAFRYAALYSGLFQITLFSGLLTTGNFAGIEFWDTDKDSRVR